MISFSLGLGKNIFLEAVASKISNFSRVGLLPKRKLQAVVVRRITLVTLAGWEAAAGRAAQRVNSSKFLSEWQVLWRFAQKTAPSVESERGLFQPKPSNVEPCSSTGPFGNQTLLMTIRKTDGGLSSGSSHGCMGSGRVTVQANDSVHPLLQSKNWYLY